MESNQLTRQGHFHLAFSFPSSHPFSQTSSFSTDSFLWVFLVVFCKIIKRRRNWWVSSERSFCDPFGIHSFMGLWCFCPIHAFEKEFHEWWWEPCRIPFEISICLSFSHLVQLCHLSWCFILLLESHTSFVVVSNFAQWNLGPLVCDRERLH